jgi:hypothetical protein
LRGNKSRKKKIYFFELKIPYGKSDASTLWKI